MASVTVALKGGVDISVRRKAALDCTTKTVQDMGRATVPLRLVSVRQVGAVEGVNESCAQEPRSAVITVYVTRPTHRAAFAMLVGWDLHAKPSV